jgi:hypothetical protein
MVPLYRTSAAHIRLLIFYVTSIAAVQIPIPQMHTSNKSGKRVTTKKQDVANMLP